MLSRVIQIVFSLAIMLFLIAPQHAFACSCGAKPTVLDLYDGSEIVIIARVVSIDRIRPAKPDDDEDESPEAAEKAKNVDENENGDEEEEEEFVDDGAYDGVRSATMVVEKVYKGGVKIGEELIFGQGSGADCIRTFDEEDIGEKYLLYLDAPRRGHRFSDEDEESDKEKAGDPLRYYAGACGSSPNIEGAEGDLAYLNNMKKLRGRTRVYGWLSDYHEDGPSVANIKIKIIGKNKTYETKTDKRGFYEIYDLPAGDYFIEPGIQKGWKVDEIAISEEIITYGRMRLETKNRVPVKLKEKRHARLDLKFTIDNEIRGKVISPSGKPMKGVCVSAVSSLEDLGKYISNSDCTNEKGEYKLETFYSGNYFLVLNSNGKLDSDQPFGVLFYPGVSDPKQAGMVSIEPGKFLSNVDIHVPQTVELVEITGKLLFSDEKPVADREIEFRPTQADLYGEKRIRTDNLGNFSLRIPKGAAGKIRGRMSVYSSVAETCPKFADAVRAAGGSTIFTEEIEVAGTENLAGVILIIPAPYCKELEK